MLEAGVYITRDGLPGEHLFGADRQHAQLQHDRGQRRSTASTASSRRTTRSRMRPQRHANKFHGNVINLADYIKSLNSNTQLPRPKSRFAFQEDSQGRQGPPRRVGPSTCRVTMPPRGAHPVRPRIPALFRDGVKSKRIEHAAAVRVGPPAGGRPSGAGTPPGPTTSSAPSLVEREVSVSLAAARSSRDDAHHRPERPH